MTYSGNRWLTHEEMAVNAQYILNYLTALGWSKNAICGMLGNMQTESSINPGIWEGLDDSNPENGYGLVQWTPSYKFTGWCATNNLDIAEMDSALLRILYEVEQNIQWIHPTMTFKEFSQSTDSAYNLAMMFLTYYERPLNPNQPQRGEQAEYWYETLTGGVIPPSFKKKKSKVFLYLKKRRYII